MDAAHAVPRRPRRLLVLLLAGALVIALALGIRFSPWAHEYQLKRASLQVLRLQAKTSPNDPLLFYHLATKAYNAQSLGEAGYCFEQAIRLNPKMARAYQGLAIVQRDAGRWEQAYASAKQAQQLDPKDQNTQFLIAMLVKHASPSRAIEEFQKVVARNPKWADAWYQMGVCQEQINQKGEALTAFRKAVALSPQNPQYQRDLGKVLLDTNFFAEARTTLELARKLDPQDAQTAYLLGETRVKAAQGDDDLREGDQLYAESQRLVGPPARETATILAEIADARGAVAKQLRQPEQALKYAELARKLNPAEARYLYNQAEALRQLGREAEGRQLMERYNVLAAAREAEFQMTERIKQDPKDPQLRLKLARLYRAHGDTARAVNQYEYCLYLDPKQLVAQRELETLKRGLATAGSPGSKDAARPTDKPQVP